MKKTLLLSLLALGFANADSIEVCKASGACQTLDDYPIGSWHSFYSRDTSGKWRRLIAVTVETPTSGEWVFYPGGSRREKGEVSISGTFVPGGSIELKYKFEDHTAIQKGIISQDGCSIKVTADRDSVRGLADGTYTWIKCHEIDKHK